MTDDQQGRREHWLRAGSPTLLPGEEQIVANAAEAGRLVVVVHESMLPPAIKSRRLLHALADRITVGVASPRAGAELLRDYRIQPGSNLIGISRDGLEIATHGVSVLAPAAASSAALEQAYAVFTAALEPHLRSDGLIATTVDRTAGGQLLGFSVNYRRLSDLVDTDERIDVLTRIGGVRTALDEAQSVLATERVLLHPSLRFASTPEETIGTRKRAAIGIRLTSGDELLQPLVEDDQTRHPGAAAKPVLLMLTRVEGDEAIRRASAGSGESFAARFNLSHGGELAQSKTDAVRRLLYLADTVGIDAEALIKRREQGPEH